MRWLFSKLLDFHSLDDVWVPRAVNLMNIFFFPKAKLTEMTIFFLLKGPGIFGAKIELVLESWLAFQFQ